MREMSRNRETFSVTSTVNRTPLHGVPLVKIKETVLGKHYRLSLVCIGDKRSQALNRTYRKKNKPAGVLAFPLSKDEGELFINETEALREAPAFLMPPKDFLVYLFIHGLLHLKGMRHGGRMTRTEKTLLQRFEIPHTRRKGYGRKTLQNA